MDDNLERFVKNNRDRFDEPFNEDKVWQNILDKSGEKNRRFRFMKTSVYWKAAAVILLMVCAALLVDKYGVDRTSAWEASKHKETLNEFNEAEGYYMSLIQDKQQMLKEELEEKPALKKEFTTELEELDSAYAHLKNNLDEGNTESVVDALIINLQLRIEILNKQLMILKKLKDKKNETVI